MQKNDRDRTSSSHAGYVSDARTMKFVRLQKGGQRKIYSIVLDPQMEQTTVCK